MQPSPRPSAHFPHSLIQDQRGFHLGRFSNAGRGRASEQRSATTRIRKPSPRPTAVRPVAPAMLRLRNFEAAPPKAVTRPAPAELAGVADQPDGDNMQETGGAKLRTLGILHDVTGPRRTSQDVTSAGRFSPGWPRSNDGPALPFRSRTEFQSLFALASRNVLDSARVITPYRQNRIYGRSLSVFSGFVGFPRGNEKGTR